MPNGGTIIWLENHDYLRAIRRFILHDLSDNFTVTGVNLTADFVQDLAILVKQDKLLS